MVLASRLPPRPGSRLHFGGLHSARHWEGTSGPQDPSPSMLASPEGATLPSGLQLLVLQVTADSSLLLTTRHIQLSQLLPGPLQHVGVNRFRLRTIQASEISKRLSKTFPHLSATHMSPAPCWCQNNEHFFVGLCGFQDASWEPG